MHWGEPVILTIGARPSCAKGDEASGYDERFWRDGLADAMLDNVALKDLLGKKW